MITSLQAADIAVGPGQKPARVPIDIDREGIFMFADATRYGLVIDSRALTETENEVLTGMVRPKIAVEHINKSTGKIVAFRHPFRISEKTIDPQSDWEMRFVSIYAGANKLKSQYMTYVLLGIQPSFLKFDAAGMLEECIRIGDLSAHEKIELMINSERCARSRQEDPRHRSTAAA